TRDAARPAIAAPVDRRIVERLRAGRRFELANAADPREKFRFVVLRTAAHMRELQMRVAVHETGNENRVRKLEGLGVVGTGDAGMVAHGSNSARVIHENGAVLEGRRRDRMNPASSNTK